MWLLVSKRFEFYNYRYNILYITEEHLSIFFFLWEKPKSLSRKENCFSKNANQKTEQRSPKECVNQKYAVLLQGLWFTLKYFSIICVTLCLHELKFNFREVSWLVTWRATLQRQLPQAIHLLVSQSTIVSLLISILEDKMHFYSQKQWLIIKHDEY